MRGLLILGAGGHGKVVADTARLCGWEDIAFLDDGYDAACPRDERWPIIGKFDAFSELKKTYDYAVVALGSNPSRWAWQRKLQSAGFRFPTLVHPSAYVSKDVELGAGTVVFANAVINVDARVGAAVIINTGATVDHEAVLHEGVHVSPGAHLAGRVEVGRLSWIGIGAVVRQDIRIDENVVVGAGAAVVADVPANTTVVGVPAK